MKAGWRRSKWSLRKNDRIEGLGSRGAQGMGVASQMNQDEIFRPGGFDITARLISLSGLPPGAAVLDVGCGSGATVRFLRGTYGIEAFGIDSASEGDKAGFCREPHIIKGVAEEIPFDDGSLDGIICECCFSLFADPEAVLDEYRRTIKPGGALLMSDVYAKAHEPPLHCSAVHFFTKKRILELLESKAFAAKAFEDRSDELKAMAGQMIMESGAGAFYGALGASRDEIIRAECGYYLGAWVNSSLGTENLS